MNKSNLEYMPGFNENHKESILIVDDHPVVLHGLEMMIKELRPSAIIKTVLSAEQALQSIDDSLGFDWILIDINLPKLSGIGLIEAFNEKKVVSHIILLSSEMTPEIIEEGIQHSVNGVLSKSFNQDMFSLCFETIEAGDFFIVPEHLSELKYFRQHILNEKQRIEKTISSRQLEVLSLISKGFSNIEISEKLNLSVHTIKSHSSNLYTLFGVENRTHCVSEAKRLKII